MAIPKRVASRIDSGVKRFRKILEAARNADRSEQDTVIIVTDILGEVFGYDKYSELSGEYQVRGTYCDLAIIVDGKVHFLVEIKAVDKTLRDRHIRQATDYAAKEGIEWVVLTNGILWQVYRMYFDQPVRAELSFCLNLLEPGKDTQEQVYTLSREGVSKRAIEAYHEQVQALDRYMLAAVILGEPVLRMIRREVRRLNPNVRVDMDDIAEVMRTQVIKRDVVEGEESENAFRVIRRAAKSAARLRGTRRSKRGEAVNAGTGVAQDGSAGSDQKGQSQPRGEA